MAQTKTLSAKRQKPAIVSRLSGWKGADLRQFISEVSGKLICRPMELREYISATEIGTNTSQSLCQELGQIFTKINMSVLHFSRRKN